MLLDVKIYKVIFFFQTTTNAKMGYKFEWDETFCKAIKKSIEVNAFSLVISTNFSTKV